MYTCITKMQEFDLRYNCITTNSHSSQVFFQDYLVTSAGLIFGYWTP